MGRILVGIKIEPKKELRDRLAHQLAIAPKLSEFTETMTCGWQAPDGMDRRKAAILMALADKSFRTFDTIYFLMRETTGVDDASALLRVLYESVLTTAFLLDADEQTVDDYAGFFMYANWRDHNLFSQVDSATAEAAFPPEVVATMRAQFDSVQGRYSGSRWTRVTVEDMARKADEKLPLGFKVFAYLYEASYRQLSAYAHSDVRSIQGRIHELAEDGRIQIRRDVSEVERSRVMYYANYLMLCICLVITGTFYGKKHVQEWNSLVLQWNGGEEALSASSAS